MEEQQPQHTPDVQEKKMTSGELFAALRRMLPDASNQQIAGLREALVNADPKHLDQLVRQLRVNPNAKLHVDVRSKSRGFADPEKPDYRDTRNRKERRKAAALARRSKR